MFLHSSVLLSPFVTIRNVPMYCFSVNRTVALVLCTFWNQECAKRCLQMLKTECSLDACRFKCVSYVLRCLLARRLSTKMRFLCAQMRSRLTPVYPNAFSFGNVYLDSKIAWSRSGQKGVQLKPYGSKSVIVLRRCFWVRKWIESDVD